MGLTKTAQFTDLQNKKAIIFKALGHPARVAIIEYIITQKTCICNDLVDTLPLSQATISQHLKELKAAKIIKGTIEGNSLCYCLNPELLIEIKLIIEQYIDRVEENESPCC
ncbi:MAG: ArsR/SmtB family transcription factor [Flavobacteriia bacterium]|jgi:DNA-binding transcriptional ArsR family regulator